MGITIRQIEQCEYPSFTATADYIADTCFADGIVLLAETETGFPMGVLAAKRAMMFQEISYVFVKPLFRSRGIASALFARLFELSPDVTFRIKDARLSFTMKVQQSGMLCFVRCNGCSCGIQLVIGRHERL